MNTKQPPYNGTAQKQFWVSAGILALAVLGSFVGIVLQMGSLANQADQAKTERAGMIRRIELLEGESSAHRVAITQLQTALKEVETQFCGSDNVRNQIQAHDLRLMSMLWEKAYGQTMPLDNAFYPSVGQCRNGAVK